MTEQEIRSEISHWTPEQLLDMAVYLMLHEQEMRRELDDLKGIIR